MSPAESSEGSVRCVYCEDSVPRYDIADHHSIEHPEERYDPVWYRESSDPSDGHPGMDHPTAQPTNRGQPSDPSDRIREGNETKFAPFGHAITANEVHAVLIGGNAGAALAYAAHIGLEQHALGIAGVLLGYAILGSPVLRSLPHTASEYPRTIALRTIRYEPWWFATAFLIAGAVVHGVVA